MRAEEMTDLGIEALIKESGRTGEQAVLGIDVGGTKVCVGLVTEGGRVVDLIRYPQRFCGIGEWTQELEGNIDRLLEKNGLAVKAIGIGARGHVDYQRQLLLASTIMDVTPGFDLCGRLGNRYGCRAYIDNDVKAVACAELVLGAGRECGNFICYNVGTGIAAAVVADARLIRGEYNNAGEICGDVIHRPDGDTGHCGLEGAASGRGISQEAVRRLADRPESVLNRCAGPITAGDVFAACREGDPLAEAVTDSAVHMLAVSVVGMQHLLDPDRFIFVGGVVSDTWFFERLKGRIWELARETGAEWKAGLQISGFGTEYAGLLGAASVAFYGMREFGAKTAPEIIKKEEKEHGNEGNCGI